MKKVLIVSAYGSNAGGAEQWLLGILRQPHLRDAHLQVDAVILQDGPLREDLRAAGVATLTVGVAASPASILRRSAALRRAILARRPDVVVGNGVKAQLALSVALAGTGIPTIWVKHDHSYDASLAKVLARRASAVVATAREVGVPTGRDDLTVIEPARPPEPLPRPVAEDVLRPRGYGSMCGLTLAMITRLVPYKGVDLAITALADSRASHWTLLVIGDDDPSTPGEADRLRALAQQLGVEDRVILAGGLPQAGRLLSAVDATAVLTRPGHPGAPGKEGYGIVASESMVAGVPVVVAQSGPISRRLATRSGPAGLTLAAPRADHLADALARLQDPETRQAMGDSGRNAARRLPSEDQVAAAFTAVIVSVSR